MCIKSIIAATLNWLLQTSSLCGYSSATMERSNPLPIVLLLYTLYLCYLCFYRVVHVAGAFNTYTTFLPTAGYPPLAPLAIPSVVSGAQKTVKDLQQMATADAEAIIDSIEELMQGARHGDGTATVTRLADPVLTKSSQPSTQGELHAKPPGQRISLGCLPSTDYLSCSAAAAMILFLHYFWLFACFVH